MSAPLDNPHAQPGFEADGRPVPIVEPDIFFDDPPVDPAPTNGFDVEQFLDALITGARDGGDIAARVLVLGMLMKRPGAPGNMTEFGLWLNIPRTTAQRKWAAILQCLQGEMQFFGQRRPLVED